VRRAALATILVLACSLARAQEAPYERDEADGFVVVRLPQDAALARGVRALFAESRALVEQRLGVSLGSPPPVLILAPSDPEFARLHRELAGHDPDEWALAVAITARRTVIVRANRIGQGSNFLAPTLRHELAHLALARVRVGLPRWFEEGTAEYATGEVLSRSEELDLAGGARFGALPPIDELAVSFPAHSDRAQRAYRLSLSFVRWIDERSKPEGLPALLKELARGATLDEAVERGTGLKLADAERAWHEELARKHSIPEALLHSSGFWWGLVSLLAIVAAVRQRFIARRLARKMEQEDG
jgi:hypothetical protein